MPELRRSNRLRGVAAPASGPGSVQRVKRLVLVTKKYKTTKRGDLSAWGTQSKHELKCIANMGKWKASVKKMKKKQRRAERRANQQ